MFSQENYSIMKQRKNNLLATNIWKTEMAKQSDQMFLWNSVQTHTKKSVKITSSKTRYDYARNLKSGTQYL